MSRADLIVKLSVRKDERTVPQQEVQGRFRYLFSCFNANLTKLLLPVNLIYVAIFALPLLFCMFILPQLVLNYTMAGKVFEGNLGIGFPNIADDLSVSLTSLMHSYRVMIFPLSIASIVLAFVGFAGLFHVARGVMWGEKVKVKSFFRGIKLLWRPFLITGIVVAGIAAGLMYGIGWSVECMLLGTAGGGSWTVFALLLLVGFAGVMFLGFLLPTFACYRFKASESLKNAALFIGIMPVPTIINAILVIGVCLLTLVSPMLSYLFLGAFFFLGFSFIALVFTNYSQLAFDNFIAPQVDPKNPERRREVDVRRTNAKNAYNAQKGNAKSNAPKRAQDYGTYKGNKKKRK